MNAPARLSVRAYPTQRAIAHVVNAAKKLGVDVAGIEVDPSTGTIRAIDARVMPKKATLFDQLEEQGKL
jgi:hypothetical protein